MLLSESDGTAVTCCDLWHAVLPRNTEGGFWTSPAHRTLTLVRNATQFLLGPVFECVPLVSLSILLSKSIRKTTRNMTFWASNLHSACLLHCAGSKDRALVYRLFADRYVFMWHLVETLCKHPLPNLVKTKSARSQGHAPSAARTARKTSYKIMDRPGRMLSNLMMSTSGHRMQHRCAILKIHRQRLENGISVTNHYD